MKNLAWKSLWSKLKIVLILKSYNTTCTILRHSGKERSEILFLIPLNTFRKQRKTERGQIMDSTERKEEKKMKAGKGNNNEQEGQFTDGNFSAWKYPCFCFVFYTYSAAEGKHGFSNLSPCWGRGLRASLAR